MNYVSMISRDFINKLDDALQQITKNHGVFGGNQVIFFGDIAQLAPVKWEHYGFYFEAKAFEVATQFRLRVSRRQNLNTESEFVHILNNIRLNEFNPAVCNFILDKHSLESGIPRQYLRLFPTRKEVEAYNNS